MYDFSGIRNVERALEMAEEEGMYVIARTGPYVNAELTGGGYPGWMFRNRAEARTDDPVYLAAVDEWMTQINAIIARHQVTTGGGNVIAYQIENELGKVEPKHVRHMEHLATKARADGISVPFFHNAAGRLPDWAPKGSSRALGQSRADRHVCLRRLPRRHLQRARRPARARTRRPTGASTASRRRRRRAR